MLLTQVYALRNERLKLVEELTVPGAINGRHAALVIERKVNVRYFQQDIHDKLETCRLKIDFSLRIQALDGLHKMPFKYFIV